MFHITGVFASNPARLMACCLQDILNVTKASLYNNLKRSLSRYLEMSRPEWLMHKNPTSGDHYGYWFVLSDASITFQVINSYN